MTSSAARYRQRIIDAPLAASLYGLLRVVWWAGLALVIINFYTSPLSEWIDRDHAATARSGGGFVLLCDDP